MVVESPKKVASPVPSRIKTMMIRVVDIIPTKDNTREFDLPGRQERLQALAATIKEKGLLQPIVVRPHPTKPGKYDLRAGERRWRATKIAGFDVIEARVMQLSDLDAEEATIIENFHREDLTPMETATAIHRLIDSKNAKATLRDIGSHLGLTASMVLRRARLTALTKRWQKVMDERKFPQWGTGHYELIARFEPKIQDHLLDHAMDRFHRYESLSLRDMEKHLANQTRFIHLAAWDPVDETLVPKAGACAKCPFNSGCKPGLFDDLQEPGKTRKTDRCTNLACWEAKDGAQHERAKVEVLKKHPGLVVVSSQFRTEADGLPGRDSFDLARKSEKGAYQAMWDDGEERGKMFWAKPKADASKKAVKAMTGKEPAPTPLKERRAAIAKRRNVHVLDAMHTQIGEGKVKPPGLPVVVSCLSVFGTIRNISHADADSWKTFDSIIDGEDAQRLDRLWKQLSPVIAQRLKSAAINPDPAMGEATRWCGLLGLDYKALQAAALAAIPDPKIWATLNENGTPKAAQKATKTK